MPIIAHAKTADKIREVFVFGKDAKHGQVIAKKRGCQKAASFLFEVGSSSEPRPLP